jgi:hypothetical protein
MTKSILVEKKRRIFKDKPQARKPTTQTVTILVGSGFSQQAKNKK